MGSSYPSRAQSIRYFFLKKDRRCRTCVSTEETNIRQADRWRVERERAGLEELTCQTPSPARASSVRSAKRWTRRLVDSGFEKGREGRRGSQSLRRPDRPRTATAQRASGTQRDPTVKRRRGHSRSQTAQPNALSSKRPSKTERRTHRSYPACAPRAAANRPSRRQSP